VQYVKFCAYVMGGAGWGRGGKLKCCCEWHTLYLRHWFQGVSYQQTKDPTWRNLQLDFKTVSISN